MAGGLGLSTAGLNDDPNSNPGRGGGAGNRLALVITHLH
jgi:hypothetical protein